VGGGWEIHRRHAVFDNGRSSSRPSTVITFEHTYNLNNRKSTRETRGEKARVKAYKYRVKDLAS
jgi:hypothetical protein